MLVVKVSALLSESQAFTLKWNGFCNATAKRARNIPLDLQLEHDNNFVKAFLKSFGANLNEVNAQRVAASLNHMIAIMQTVDEDCKGQSRTGTVRGGKDPAETVKQITDDLVKGMVFEECQGRSGFKGLEKFSSDLTEKLDYRNLFHWIKDHREYGTRFTHSNPKIRVLIPSISFFFYQLFHIQIYADFLTVLSSVIYFT